jgi:hypothetical protein
MDTETAYNLALDYLYSFVDYSLKHASELAKADFNLERMFALMDSSVTRKRNIRSSTWPGRRAKARSARWRQRLDGCRLQDRPVHFTAPARLRRTYTGKRKAISTWRVSSDLSMRSSLPLRAFHI